MKLSYKTITSILQTVGFFEPAIEQIETVEQLASDCSDEREFATAVCDVFEIETLHNRHNILSHLKHVETFIYQ